MPKDDRLFRLLQQMEVSELRFLLKEVLKLRGGSIPPSKAELVEVASAEIRSAAGNSVVNLKREAHEFAYKQILIDVADRLSGRSCIKWTKYKLEYVHSEDEIELYIVNQFQERLRERWARFNARDKREFIKKLRKGFGRYMVGQNYFDLSSIDETLVKEVVEKGITALLGKVGARGLMGVFGLTMLQQIGWYIVVATLGYVEAIKMSFGLSVMSLSAVGGLAVGGGVALVGLGVAKTLPNYNKTVPAVIYILISEKFRQETCAK